MVCKFCEKTQFPQSFQQIPRNWYYQLYQRLYPRNNRTSCEMCLKLTIKTQERRHWHRPGIFIVNFEHVIADEILGPLLFNIFICDMCLILKTSSFTGYTDVNIPFVVKGNTNDVIKALEQIGKNLIKSFSSTKWS